MPERGWLRRRLTAVINDDNLDLYLLATIAMVFTVLGATGVSDIKVLSSVVLALLAILALSQIRSRRLTEQIRNAQRPDPTALFQRTFPEGFRERRAEALDLLLIGLAMTRTIQNMRVDMSAMLAKGCRIRVLVGDPTNDSLMEAAAGLVTDNLGFGRKLQGRIRTTLDDLLALRAATNGRLEIRVSSTIPTAGFTCVDMTSPRGQVHITHYGHRPPGEASPIFTLTPDEIPWFQHFSAEAERLWDSGIPWPLSPSEQIGRVRRPMFSESFGPEFAAAVEGASDLFVTGMARNAFVMTHYHMLERKLRAGVSMRILLINPDSPAIEVAAERYYVARSAVSTRERVLHTLRLLTQLQASTLGALSVRLTDHPLAMGIVATDVGPDGKLPTIFAEYYSYRTPSDPKFAIQPANAGYEGFLQEAEALWDSGKPHVLE